MDAARAKRAVLTPTILCTALSALSSLWWPRAAYPALPPPAADAPAPRNEPGRPASAAPGGKSGAAAAAAEPEPAIGWTFPPIRWGGSISYDIRKDAGEGTTMTQRGAMVTVNAATETFIWQPWFAQLKGILGVTTSTNSMKRSEIEYSENNGNKSVVWTGNGQLSVLPQTRFPFEAHFEKADSRVSNDIAAGASYESSRFGMTQHYLRQEGDAMIGWERTTQNSDTSGRDRQDSLQLVMTHSLENHRLNFNGNHALNKHDMTGESTVQNNLALQHSYSPVGTVSVESMVNVSRSGYHLQQGENDTRLNQLSSLAFWRPEEQPMTVTAGVRMLTLAADTTGFGLAGGTSSSARIRNANANVGMAYDLTKYLHMNAAANANQNASTNSKSMATSEMAGLTYQPDPIPLAGFQYNWTTSGTVSNRAGGQDAGRQLTLQLSHSLSRTFQTGEESNLSIEMSQGISTSLRKTDSITAEGNTTKMLTHSGSIGWNMNGESGSALIRLSASDSRALGGNQEFFQMINLQAYSNLPTSVYSSWNGNLTVQAVRQGSAVQVGSLDPNTVDYYTQQNSANQRSFVITSSGSLTYQHQRAFGIRRLRFTSDVRINSQALLPLLAGPKDQEVAAWENRFDYIIGRTQLRTSILYGRTKGLNVTHRVDETGHVIAESGTRRNKSIMFTLTRSFGDF